MTCIDYVIGFGLHSQDGREASPIFPGFLLVPTCIPEVFSLPKFCVSGFKKKEGSSCTHLCPYSCTSPLFPLIAQSLFKP